MTLAYGRWTGAPPALGAASRPSVELAGEFRVVGDLDGDGGLEEAVAVLTYSSGGTGVVSFLAVVTQGREPAQRGDDRARDRVLVRSARVDGGRLLVSPSEGERTTRTAAPAISSNGSGPSATAG